MSDSILDTIEWALNSSRDKLLFGRDELGGALARESRLKGVLLDCKEEIAKLEAENKRQSAIIDHIKESGAIGDIYCGDKSFFSNGWYSVLEFIELAIRGEI